MAAATSLLVASTALSAGTSILGASRQAEALRMQGDYQRSIAEQNARSLDLNAADAIDRGKTAASEIRKKAKALIGSQRAGFAGQGVDVNSGTAISVQDEAYTMGESDALTIANNAWREAWGYKTKARDTRGQGRLAQMTSRVQGRNTMLTGGLQAASSVLTGTYKARS